MATKITKLIGEFGTVHGWLQYPCNKEDVKGDEYKGFFLGIDLVKEKLRQMDEKFGTRISYHGFSHLLFTSPNRSVYASGSLNVVIHFADGTEKRLVGAATFNVDEYHPNEHFAATLKSLCVCNAMTEYPQFGSLLNKELVASEVKAPAIPVNKAEERIKLLIDDCKTLPELLVYKQVPKNLKPYFEEAKKRLTK